MKSGLTRLTLLWGFLLSLNCWSATVLPLGLERLQAAAELVFDGVCISNQVVHDPISGMAVTYTTFNILENLKGARLQTYTIKQIGGSLPEDGSAWVTPGVPRFVEGQRYILFVPPPSDLAA